MKLRRQLGVLVRSVWAGLTGTGPTHAAGVVSAFVALTLLGAGMLLSAGVENATTRWRDGVESIVFVNAGATSVVAEQVGATVQSTSEVKDARYVGQQETLEEFRAMFADSPQLVQSVDSGMLPTSWRVRFNPGTASELTEEISHRWETVNGVYQVVTEREAVGAVTQVAAALRRVLMIVAFCVGVAGVLMSFASSRAAAWARRDELAVMRLIGAPRWMVRVPFVTQGALDGLVGGLIATPVLWWLARFVQVRAAQNEQLAVVRDFGIGLGEIVMVGAQVTFLGVIAGAVTAALAVGRYAKATEGAETGWWQRPVGRTVKQRSAGKGVNLDAGVARAGSAQSEETQLVDIKTAVFEEHEWVVEREEETSR